MMDLSTLNASQCEAVQWEGGPLLVLAGPGSGKTRVLTYRIVKLIEDSPTKRFRILALTFTNKAAAEMRERIDSMLLEGRPRVLLTTFHSFCADVLRQHGSHIGVAPDYSIINQDSDRESVLADAIRALQNSGHDVDDSEVKLLPIVGQLMENCVPEAQVRSAIRDTSLAARVSPLYSAYRVQLRQNNRLDYPSLLFAAHELFAKAPEVVEQLRMVYTHICVDEFQDTNLAQYTILRDLVGTNPNLFVVADDDQIIYQWNGASPERLRALINEFKMSVLQLPENYRCPAAVIDLANKLIAHNVDRSPGKSVLCAVKSSLEPDAVRFKSFESADEELAWIADDILSRDADKRRECVLLARTRKLLDSAVRALNDKGLQAHVAMRKDEFESTPLRWVHSVLRLANARGDREQLRRVCKAFYLLEGIEVDVQEVIAFSAAMGGDLLRTWVSSVKDRSALSEETRTLVMEMSGSLAERLDFALFLRQAFRWLDLLQHRPAAPEDVFADFDDEKQIWSELQGSVLEKYGEENVTLTVLLQEFDLTPKTRPIPADAIRCFTIHGAKGMEFAHVYLFGMVEDQLPAFAAVKKGDASREMQEERRGCFVAITRAQISLTLTCAKRYFGWTKQPSRFLREMGVQ